MASFAHVVPRLWLLQRSIRSHHIARVDVCSDFVFSPIPNLAHSGVCQRRPCVAIHTRGFSSSSSQPSPNPPSKQSTIAHERPRTHTHNHAHLRDFLGVTRNCWKCHQQRIVSPGVCANRACGALQPPPKDRGPFEVFGIPRAFDVDIKELERIYKKLQSQLHPDRFVAKSQEEQSYSADHATEVNLAYTTLKDPLQRAKYLLRTHGLDAGGEGTISDITLLSEMLERREEIAEATGNKKLLDNLRQRYIAEVDELLKPLSAAFRTGDVVLANKLTIRMSYLSSALQDIERLIG